VGGGWWGEVVRAWTASWLLAAGLSV
jgi:hypothetical protein